MREPCCAFHLVSFRVNSYLGKIHTNIYNQREHPSKYRHDGEAVNSPWALPNVFWLETGTLIRKFIWNHPFADSNWFGFVQMYQSNFWVIQWPFWFIASSHWPCLFPLPLSPPYPAFYHWCHHYHLWRQQLAIPFWELALQTLPMNPPINWEVDAYADSAASCFFFFFKGGLWVPPLLLRQTPGRK